MTSELDLDDGEWEPVNSGDMDSFPLGFCSAGNEDENQDRDTLYLNEDQDGEPVPVENNRVVGVYRGREDVSSSDNPNVVMKHLVENGDEGYTYAFNTVTVLESQREEVEEGRVVRITYDGYKEGEESGRPYQDLTVEVVNHAS